MQMNKFDAEPADDDRPDGDDYSGSDDDESESDEELSDNGDNEDDDRLFLRDVGLVYRIRYYVGLITYANVKEKTQWLMDTATLTVSFSLDDISMYMTIFVLFATDINYISGHKSGDSGIEIMNAICMFYFIFELCANTWSKTLFTEFYPKLKWEGYIFSFFWWLDIVAIVSMFFEIRFVANGLGVGGALTSSGSGGSYGKAGRVIRLVRLVRLVRLYRIWSENRRRRLEEEEVSQMAAAGLVDYATEMKRRSLAIGRGSKLGTQLSASITKRVILIILVMLIVLPLLTYTSSNEPTAFATETLHNINIDKTINNASKAILLDEFIYDMHGIRNDYLVLLVFQPLVPGYVINMQDKIDSLRDSAIIEEIYQFYDPSTGIRYITRAMYNNSFNIAQLSMFSIFLTIFVGLMLIIGTVVLTNDAQRLVVDPIERMMNIVDAVAKDPLSPIKIDAGSGPVGYETLLLETTLEKITGLLRVCFGEAGAGIVKTNLDVGQDGASSGAAINALLPGVRVYALVGFCDIHAFDFALEKLTADILTFVNSIAAIVHSRISQWGGNCNKNLGNAFVIVWRIGDENAVGGGPTEGMDADAIRQRNARIDLRRVAGVDMIADRALVGYLKIIAEINRNKRLMIYRKDIRLTQNFTKTFKVRMGFGLHAGWAIEGAVGSVQKVDATYLSPHVNMAARLETASRQYGTPILISHLAHELFSADVQSKCRKLDVVTVKGSEVPIGIFTYDTLQEQLFAYDNSTRPQRGVSNKTGEPGGGGPPLSKKAMKLLGIKVDEPPKTAASQSASRGSFDLPPDTEGQQGKSRASFEAPASIPLLVTSSSGEELQIDPRLLAGGASPRPFRKSIDKGISDGADRRQRGSVDKGVSDTAESPRRNRGSFDKGIHRHSIDKGIPDPAESPHRNRGSDVHRDSVDKGAVGGRGIEKGNRNSFTGRRGSNESVADDDFDLTELGYSLSGKPLRFMKGAESTAVVFDCDYDINRLRSHITEEFLSIFSEGVSCYLKGEWNSAKSHFEKSDKLMAELAPTMAPIAGMHFHLGDRPSQTLLRYMGDFNFVAPVDWKGFRPLTSK